MPLLISPVVAAAILLHTLLGCCMHHRHDAATLGLAASGVAFQPDTCGHCQRDTAPSPATGEGSPQDRTGWWQHLPGQDRRGHDDPLGCDGGVCSFIAGDTPGVDLRRDLRSDWAVAIASSAAHPLGQCRSSIGRPGGIWPPPPIDCSQARLCIWLI